MASHCFYGLFVAGHLGQVEYMHILKEQAIQEVSESSRLWAWVIIELVSENSFGRVNFAGFVMACTHL